MRNFQTVFFLLLFFANYSRAGKLPSPCYLLELSSFGFPIVDNIKEARRINDLSIFSNKLYLGCGDAVANSGPTAVIYYDFFEKEFVHEFTVDDEAIYTYKIVNNKLMIPGTDATEDWSFGNVYILNDTGWIKYRTIPKGLHVMDLLSFNNKLFASTISEGAVGEETKIYFGGVYCSSDTGKTWKLSYATQSDDLNVYHLEHLIVYKNKLYAFPYAHYGVTIDEIPERYHATLSKPMEEIYHLLIADDVLGACDVLIYEGSRWRCQDLISRNQLGRISKPFVFKDMLVMPALFGEYLDYLSSREKLAPQADSKIFTFDGQKTKPLKFSYDIIIDVLIDNERLYLLIKEDNRYFISQTEDLKKWEYYLIPPSIRDPTSIEYKNDIFYVGTKNGNIFESVMSIPIKSYEEAELFVPPKIFGAAELPEDGKWYWVAITKWQDPDKLAKISAEVKFGNVIKVSTDNISKMSIFLPFYHLDLNHEIIVIIDDNLVYEGRINDTKELICTREEKNGEIEWQIEKGIYSFDEYKIMK